jgi:hypothetical protein
MKSSNNLGFDIVTVIGIDFFIVEFFSSFDVDELVVLGVHIFNLLHFSGDGSGFLVRIVRNGDSRERVDSVDSVFFVVNSQNDGGMDNSGVFQDGSNVGFFFGHFGGNESGGFRGNIHEHSSDGSIARLSVVVPSIDTGSGADGVFFSSGHASTSGFAPSAVGVGGTEVAGLDSKA